MFFNTDFDSTYFCSRSCPFRVLLRTPALFCPFERFTSFVVDISCVLFCPSLFFGSEIPTQIPLVFCRLFVRTSSLSLSAPKTFYETTTTTKKRRKHRRRLCALLARVGQRDKKSATTTPKKKRLFCCVELSNLCSASSSSSSSSSKINRKSWLTSQS